MPTLFVKRRARERFTLDGSDALEAHLADLCQRVLHSVQEILPPPRLEGLVLGGGYGRGQGGVLKTESGDRPYNDLEFYVFVRGNRLAAERRFRPALDSLSDSLSSSAGLHVEFKIDSLSRLRRGLVSMFSYDLVVRHRCLSGGHSLFRGCDHHLVAERIPLAEATRLLLNRCTGLLLVQELLLAPNLTAADADFIGRNLRKAQLALGDAVLCTWGQYHWSCLERQSRLDQVHVRAQTEADLELPPAWAAIRQHHTAGVQFKLHPRRLAQSTPEFARDHREISELALQIWLWLESRRLGCKFASPQSYALSPLPKCPDCPSWRNLLLNLRTFGARSLLDFPPARYPRERLFHSLPLLLWTRQLRSEPDTVRFLQRQLHSQAADWTGLVQDYKRLWTRFG